MIESFCHKGLESLYLTGSKRGITPHLAEKLLDILDLLDAAKVIEDMNFPGSNLHPWQGVKDVWSVSVTGNWRVVFEFRDGKASQIRLTDPH
ncbi:MAG: type II toxin-antitoxin system RelE/ParE family toxin [Magnetococcales bacterium]|nr:type II toxin-antitoxin system RelE/ParE family toxin [Magnetococcales bacterium]